MWLVWDRGPALLVLLDVLRAFAGGGLLRFAVALDWCGTERAAVGGRGAARRLDRAAGRACARRGTPGCSAFPRRPWSAGWSSMPCSPAALQGRHRPRRRGLVALAAAAGFDAVVSLRHLAATDSARRPQARAEADCPVGPVIGTTALLWALWKVQRCTSRATGRIDWQTILSFSLLYRAARPCDAIAQLEQGKTAGR